ncbi:hypothetical protein SCA6_003801 [Theobroma cacao]
MTKIKAATASRYTNETERQTDRQALPAIKARMPVDPYRVISAWNNSLHFCNWRRRVVNLNAIELGSITPIELGSLSKTLYLLRRCHELFQRNNSPFIWEHLFSPFLSLMENYLIGNIPVELGQLSILSVGFKQILGYSS